jgi:glutaconyl-CoA/methylmalonyl-CoA decarboxylase subunit delta
MNDLMWGLQMTVIGMGLVFGLLALLWGLLTLVQRLDRDSRAAAAATSAAEPTPGVATRPDALEPPAHARAAVDGMDAALVAAIMAATLAHRALRRREAAPVMRSYLPGSQASRWLGAGRARQMQSWQRRGKA